MEPRIVDLAEKKLIGQHMEMSLVDNKTGQLWAGFMPVRKNILNAINDDLISMQVYPPDYYAAFKPANSFIKWAAVEVSGLDDIPNGMEAFTLPAGRYAVFDYKGLSNDPSIFQYIFNTWLPNSQYVFDDRPHFEVLGKKYKNNDPDSEEEIWIPVKEKGS